MLRVLAGPAVLHGLYDVLLQYQCRAAALGVAAVSFGWLAWRIEAARLSELHSAFLVSSDSGYPAKRRKGRKAT